MLRDVSITARHGRHEVYELSALLPAEADPTPASVITHLGQQPRPRDTQPNSKDSVLPNLPGLIQVTMIFFYTSRTHCAHSTAMGHSLIQKASLLALSHGCLMTIVSSYTLSGNN